MEKTILLTRAFTPVIDVSNGIMNTKFVFPCKEGLTSFLYYSPVNEDTSKAVVGSTSNYGKTGFVHAVRPC